MLLQYWTLVYPFSSGKMNDFLKFKWLFQGRRQLWGYFSMEGGCNTIRWPVKIGSLCNNIIARNQAPTCLRPCFRLLKIAKMLTHMWLLHLYHNNVTIFFPADFHCLLCQHDWLVSSSILWHSTGPHQPTGLSSREHYISSEFSWSLRGIIMCYRDSILGCACSSYYVTLNRLKHA